MQKNTYEEGKAKIRAAGSTFLNPRARFSRDVSVAFVKLVAKKSTRILDSTAATGIRGIRYYLETPSKDVTLLDINRSAFKSLKSNLRLNGVEARAHPKSIQEFANTTEERFDIIDLDPFGGVTPDVNDLMKVAKDGGYFMATATDTAVLCGANSKACRRIYDSKPLHNEICHEVGIRILIGFIDRVAAQFSYGIDVLAAFSYMHYMRVFLKLEKGAKPALESMAHMGYVYYCNGCFYRSFSESFFPKQTTCPACGSRLETSGKMWMGPLKDEKTVEGLLAKLKMIGGEEAGIKAVETLISELDLPLYYSVPKFTKKLKISSVSPEKVMAELKKSGFSASMTHMEKACIRTDADMRDFERALSRVHAHGKVYAAREGSG